MELGEISENFDVYYWNSDTPVQFANQSADSIIAGRRGRQHRRSIPEPLNLSENPAINWDPESH